MMSGRREGSSAIESPSYRPRFIYYAGELLALVLWGAGVRVSSAGAYSYDSPVSPGVSVGIFVGAYTVTVYCAKAF
jgi:hypothetical protein